MKKFIGKITIILITMAVLTGCGKSDDNAVTAINETASEEIETTIPVIVRDSDNETSSQEQSTQLETKTNSESESESETVSQTQTESAVVDDISDSNLGQGNGAAVDVAEIINTNTDINTANENSNVSLGIDVSRYQGTIDWKQVADAGISFAMIRVGYRADSTRTITADSNAKYNMQEAQKNNIKVGVYFYSTATTQDEAIEEAKWVTDYIAQYKITFPVAYDCESYKNKDSVTYNLSNTNRTEIALAFLNQILLDGYTPMFYASSSELNNDWETSRISNRYKIWVSQYPQTPFPQTKVPSYTGEYSMWQYTNNGTIAGINKPVDVNVAYFSYNQISDAHSGNTPDEVEADVEALMNFTEVNEVVTAKDKTNLRDKPSQGNDSNIIYTLTNGETVIRTGISLNGWSRILLNDQTLYAVSNFLTTDLTTQQQAVDNNSQQSEQEGTGTGDGLKTKFTECNDIVTAKIEVNLRTLPSVTNPDATVVITLHNGEYVTRTGINTQYGWSRVEVNGQTLYCISSYLTTP